METAIHAVRVAALVVGVAAWWVLAFLAVQRGLVEHPKHAALGTPVALTGMACFGVLLVLDFAGGFSGLFIWFGLVTVGHFLVVMAPLGLWVLRRRKRNGWELGPSGSA